MDAQFIILFRNILGCFYETVAWWLIICKQFKKKYKIPSQMFIS